MPNTETKQPTCAERVQGELASRMEDITKLWALYQSGDEDGDEDLGTIWEYGLCFDYVAPDTFTDQDQGYFRWQISYGGPSDEFRFFVNPDLSMYRTEYWFMDWFDGARATLYAGTEWAALLAEIWDWFKDCGTARAEFEKASD